MLGGSTLARLLEERFGVRNITQPPRFTIDQILGWAQKHHQRTGSYPTWKAGPVHELPTATWKAVDHALRRGSAGLQGPTTLARLLREHYGVRNLARPPRFTMDDILAWAREHQQRTGNYPTWNSGPVYEAPTETWQSIDRALQRASGGLSGPTTLARILRERCGVRHSTDPPSLSIDEILRWARAYHRRTGNWPRYNSGAILEAPGETWNAVDHALLRGSRGLPGGASLARLLQDHCGIRNLANLPPLTPQQILDWAHSHRRRTGSWPTARSGPVSESPGETWSSINHALVRGSRGLPAGSSLARFLQEHC